MTKRSNAYTEAQALHLWCAMVRYTEESEESACNRWSEVQEEISNPSQCRCIARRCAMWRWLTNETGYAASGVSHDGRSPLRPSSQRTRSAHRVSLPPPTTKESDVMSKPASTRAASQRIAAQAHERICAGGRPSKTRDQIRRAMPHASPFV
jgi:hypothetical protein